jgi:hypothetical protein
MRLIRTAVLLALAFAGGMVYARAEMREACEAAGGTVATGLCRGVSAP